MTTNKPTTCWAPSTALRKLESRHNNAPCILTDGPAEFNDVALVRLSDYESLQADRDQQYDMKVKAREQRDAVTAKLKALQAECEKLRKDAGRYRHLRDRLTGPTFDNLFFLELYNAGAFGHTDDVDEDIDAAMQETNHESK